MDKEQIEGGGGADVKKQKLNYRFHNPNTTSVTADYLLKILIEANEEKVENAIQMAVNQISDQEEYGEGLSM